MHYEKEFGDKDLKTYFRKFASMQNRILIDYKKVRDFLVKETAKLERNLDLNKTQVEGSVFKRTLPQSQMVSPCRRSHHQRPLSAVELAAVFSTRSKQSKAGSFNRNSQIR